MSKTTISEDKIQAALNPNLSLEESVNVLLESPDIKQGQAVAILDGNPYELEGIRGIAKGPTSKKSGWIDVELPNKIVIPCQANLLLPV